MARRRRTSLLEEGLRLALLLLMLGAGSVTAFWNSLTPVYRVVLVALLIGLVITGMAIVIVWSRYRRQQRELAWHKATAGLREQTRTARPIQPAVTARHLTPDALEDFSRDMFRKMGYHATRTGGSGDHGVDVRLVNPRGAVEVVQCKQLNRPVSEKEVRDLTGTMVHEKATRGYFVAPGGFSAPARQWARGKSIVLVDDRRLGEMVQQAYGETG
jgi:hypothetical protein